MTQFKVHCGLIKTVSILEETLGARRYWLHNRVGGNDWEATVDGKNTVVKVRDPKMLTYLLLKLK